MPRYPFTPELLDALPEELCELFRGLEVRLLEEICSRLKIADQLNEVTVQDIRALRAHGIDLEDIKKAIRKYTNTGEDKINALLDDVVARNQAYYISMIDLAQVTAPERLIDQEDTYAIYEQTKGQYRNITQSMGFLVKQGRHKVMLPPAQAYQWALDSAELQIQSGAVSYNQAIAVAVRQLADSGLKTVSYESGHIDQLDVAVRRAVMTGVNQLNQKYREQSMDYLETDLVEVTAHLGARNKDGPNGWENHAAWQGKVYRWSAKPRASRGGYPDFERTCGYGSVTGIGGANCRHSFWPFIEGVSERTCTDAELEAMKPENRPKIKFEGKEYDDYQATQKQRQIERTVRKLKRRKTAFEAAGLTEDAQAASIRLRRLNQEYRAFSRTAGLKEQRERMRVLYPDGGDVGKTSKPLAKRTESGILNDKGYKGIPITEEAIRRVPQVRPDGWSQEQAERLQTAHRELLRAVMDKPVGTEVGAVYAPDMRLIERKIGEYAGHQIVAPLCHEPHIFVHNHPSGLTFSENDIKGFINSADMALLTAVGNNGSVYALQKSDDYSAADFVKAYVRASLELKQAKNPSEYAKIMDRFLRGAEKYGVKFITRG